MTGTEIAMLVNIAMTVGPKAYAFLVSLADGKIPTWDALMAENQVLQAKIDAEKG